MAKLQWGTLSRTEDEADGWPHCLPTVPRGGWAEERDISELLI